MGMSVHNHVCLRVGAALAWFVCTAPVFPEQLQITTYTRARGLAHNRVRCISRDSRGFLWFCAGEKLSRFDGNRFTTFDVGAGPTAIVEETPGTYWVATYGNGVCLLSLSGAAGSSRRIKTFSLGSEPGANLVNIAYRDRRGSIWAGTDKGLYMLDAPSGAAAFRRFDLPATSQTSGLFEVGALAEDNEGSLWIGTAEGLVRRLPNGHLLYYAPPAPNRIRYVRALLPDRDGRLWIGHTAGITTFRPEPAGEALALATGSHRVLSADTAPPFAAIETGHTGHAVTALHQYPDGTILAGTNGGGLGVFDGGTSHRYTTANGLSDDIIFSLGEDLAGHRWLGTSAGGAMKLERGGFIEYGKADGLMEPATMRIFESAEGRLCVVGQQWHIQWFDGQHFAGVHLNLPASSNLSPNSGFFKYSAMQDHTGEWWIASGQGVYRFARPDRLDRLASAHPKRIYSTRDGLATNVVDALMEDSKGDVWFGMNFGVMNSAGVVVRWERATQTLHSYSVADGLPPYARPRSFAEDGDGNLWVGLWQGGLIRYKQGRFTTFSLSDDGVSGVIQSLYLDSGGHPWAASSQRGAIRIDDAGADHPHFRFYTTENGLASNNVACFTEDQWHRLYIGTSNGIDLLNPPTGEIRHYPATDDASRVDVTFAYRDRFGYLWFGTDHTLLRFAPTLEGARVPPSIWISGVRVPGRRR